MFAQPAIIAAAVAPKGRVETCVNATAIAIDAGMRHERGCQADTKPVTIPELLTE